MNQRSFIVTFWALLFISGAIAQGDPSRAPDRNPGCLISTPIRPPLTWNQLQPPQRRIPACAENRLRPPQKKAVCYPRGENLASVGLDLFNDFESEDGMFIIGGIRNSGASPQNDVIVRFYLGNPQSGGTQIGEDILITSISPGSTVYDSVTWNGFTGSSQIYCIVDPANGIAEVDENDNMDSLRVGMVDGVPWVWQEINGYCHYASQSMLFNFHGAGNTVYETLELASCPYSFSYQDNWLNMLGGWGVCQGIGDIEFAGQLRNLSTILEIEPTWSYFLSELHLRIDAGIPFETSVDPYYLPQPDYDICRTYGLHSGHAVVVVGYTDDAVIFNDPGVGLDLILEPYIPDPENRGANVIISLSAFRDAVERTWGSSYLLISYQPVGPMPSHEQMLQEVLQQSIDRLDGYVDVYEPGLSLLYDVFGAPCFLTLMEDAAVATFEAVFDDALSRTGGDLGSALNILAASLDIWGCGICWHGAAVFYGSQMYPEASRLSDLSSQLSAQGDQASDEYIDLLNALYYNGGNTAIAGPYLMRMRSALGQIITLEDSVRVQLASLFGSLTEAEIGDASTRLPAEPGLTCYPNPFNDKTMVQYHLPHNSPVRLAIYNVLGQEVRELERGRRQAGFHQTSWNGRDDHGQDVSSGLYFCRLNTGGSEKIIKMALVR